MNVDKTVQWKDKTVVCIMNVNKTVQWKDKTVQGKDKTVQGKDKTVQWNKYLNLKKVYAELKIV